MINTHDQSTDAAPNDPADLDVRQPLAALLKLLERGQALDGKLNAELGPIAQELLGQMNPLDAIERMLTAQIIATFARSMYLTRHANRQRNATWFVLYSRECDRAMNLCRKQMQTLADYRRPRRTSFTSIRNANIAEQQIITTGPVSGEESYGQMEGKKLGK